MRKKKKTLEKRRRRRTKKSQNDKRMVPDAYLCGGPFPENFTILTELSIIQNLYVPIIPPKITIRLSASIYLSKL